MSNTEFIRDVARAVHMAAPRRDWNTTTTRDRKIPAIPDVSNRAPKFRPAIPDSCREEVGVNTWLPILFVMPDFDDVSVRVTKVTGILGQTLRPERLLSS